MSTHSFLYCSSMLGSPVVVIQAFGYFVSSIVVDLQLERGLIGVSGR